MTAPASNMDWIPLNIRVKTLLVMGLTLRDVVRILDWVILAVIKEGGEKWHTD